MEKISLLNYEAYFLDYWEGTLSDAVKQDVELFIQDNPDLEKVFSAYSDSSLKVGSCEKLDWSFLKQSDLEENPVLTDREALYLRISEGDISEEDQEILASLKANIETAGEAEGWDNLKLVSGNAHMPAGGLYHFDFDQEISSENYEEFCDARDAELLSKDQEFLLATFEKASPRLVEAFRPMILKPSTFLTFHNKGSLYQKEARIIPIWFVRLAAAAAIFIGIFWVWNQNSGTTNEVAVNKEAESPKVEELNSSAQLKNDSIEKQSVQRVQGDPNLTVPKENFEFSNPPQKSIRKIEKKPEISILSKEENIAKIEITPAEMDTLLVPQQPISPDLRPDDSNPGNDKLAESINGENTEQTQKTTAVTSPIDYLSLPEFAKSKLASGLDIPDEGRDEPMRFLANRVANNTGKLLNAEVKVLENQEGEKAGWSIRLGDLAISHSRSSGL